MYSEHRIAAVIYVVSPVSPQRVQYNNMINEAELAEPKRGADYVKLRGRSRDVCRRLRGYSWKFGH